MVTLGSGKESTREFILICLFGCCGKHISFSWHGVFISLTFSYFLYQDKRFCSRPIFFWSCNKPYNKASAVGGQPRGEREREKK